MADNRPGWAVVAVSEAGIVACPAALVEVARGHKAGAAWPFVGEVPAVVERDLGDNRPGCVVGMLGTVPEIAVGDNREAFAGVVLGDAVGVEQASLLAGACPAAVVAVRKVADKAPGCSVQLLGLAPVVEGGRIPVAFVEVVPVREPGPGMECLLAEYGRVVVAVAWFCLMI